MAPPLLALDAEVELASLRGTRRVALSDFFIRERETLRQADELLVAIRWPVPPPHNAGAFGKLGLRSATACSVISAAVMVESDGSGRCRRARIALGAVAPVPFRARAAEDALTGQQLSPEIIAEASRLAAEATKPIDDVRGSAAYRRRMVGVFVRRLLTRVAGDVGG